MFLKNDPEYKYLYGELGPHEHALGDPSLFRSSLNTFMSSITSSQLSSMVETPCGCAE
ncbi:hypothetical protein DPMN_003353 [Dreissena polymorpha]|uniref:Uncharacterized protein n=1 Tax=Dreissena polymorpha TaxID=45954 RepID=A0A9D4RUN2_DREPO|nr:hypothetical protein DPMN_003353 [Dreissena polymorpha]